MEYCFFFNSVMILLSSKKQKIVSTSTIKVEYIAIDHAAREKIWIKRFINKLMFKTIKPSLKSINKANLNLTKNAKS